MSIHQITKSDLEEHLNIYEHIPDLVFLAEADNEEFEAVKVITLQQYYKDKAYDEAWDAIYKIEELEDTANIICNLQYSKKKEFVEIYQNRVIIGINAKTITDQEINKSLAYLVSIEDFTPGEIYEFGEEKKIHYEFAIKIPHS